MRRIFWNFYAWPISFMLSAVYFDSIHQLQSIKCFDLAISIPPLLAVHFHIWDKKIGTSNFWKTYVFLFLIWELANNLILDPMTRNETFDPKNLVILVFLLPLYVGMIRYAFRKWPEDETPSQGDASVQEPARLSPKPLEEYEMNNPTQVPKNGLEAIPKWRIIMYLTIYLFIIGGVTIWNQYEKPDFPIWKSFLIFSIFFSLPPFFFKWLNKFTDKDYALKHFQTVMRFWYIVTAIQVAIFILKLVAEK